MNYYELGTTFFPLSRIWEAVVADHGRMLDKVGSVPIRKVGRTGDSGSYPHVGQQRKTQNED